MRTAYLACIALAGFSLAAAADVSSTEEYRFEVDPGARVSLENINGSIRISGYAGDVVNVTAHKTAGKQEYLDELEVVIDATADYVRIETRHPERKGSWFSWGNDSGGSVAYGGADTRDTHLANMILQLKARILSIGDLLSLAAFLDFLALYQAQDFTAERDAVQRGYQVPKFMNEVPLP